VLSWFAVFTKPRAEAVAAEHLTRQGFDCLYPRVRRTRPTAEGMVRKVEALFPRYLFLRADPDVLSLASVRSTRGVCGLVRAGYEPVRVPERIVETIKTRMADNDGCVRLEAPDMQPGSTVRVTDGPLVGLTGIFRCDHGNGRVRLLMEILGAGCEVDVPLHQLAVHV
jgi:transcriptional antiterminator RfaH